MAEPVLDLQAKYDELIRIREEEAAAKEELTQDLRAELEAVQAQQAKEHAEHQEAMGSCHSLCQIFTDRRRHYIEGVGQ